MKFKIRQSTINGWRKCRQYYHLKYIEKLQAKRIARPLQFGTIVHRMKQAFAEGEDPFSVLKKIGLENMKLFRAEREHYGDIIEDIELLMTDYYKYYPPKSITYLARKGQFAEHKFELDLTNEILWTGMIDAFVQTPNKLKWIMEHKNHKVLPNEDDRWRNIQSASYTRAVETLGWFRVEGLVWDYIRTKPPTRPQLLKSGEVSEKNLDSIPAAVGATLRIYKKDPKNYPKLMEQVTENQSRWFERIFTPTKKHVVDKVMSDFIDTAQEILKLSGKSKTKTIGRHCSWCEMEPICRAELRDMDVDMVKEREFHVIEEPEVTEEPADREL